MAVLCLATKSTDVIRKYVHFLLKRVGRGIIMYYTLFIHYANV